MSREHIKAMTLIDPGDSGPESALERLILFDTSGVPVLLGQSTGPIAVSDVTGLSSALSALQDKATAATDAELSAAIAALPSTFATDVELVNAINALPSTFATDAEVEAIRQVLIAADATKATATALAQEVSDRAAAVATRAPLPPTRLKGSGVPSSGLGVNGDTYLDYTNEKTYLKSAGTWAVVTDLTVSKEESFAFAGTWTTAGGGTFSTDAADSFSYRKVVTALGVAQVYTLALYSARDMTKKMLRFPFKLDSLAGWGNVTMDVSSDSGFSNRASTPNIVSADMARANEPDFYTCTPSGLYKNGNPNFAAISYLRWTFQDNGTAIRSGWLGMPVLIG